MIPGNGDAGTKAAPTSVALTVPDRQSAPECLDRFDWIDEAGRTRLRNFVALLRRWQGTHNLVSPTTLDAVWSRHVADSLQLVEHCGPGPVRWLDLGSGGGFPGMVIALALAGTRPVDMTLVEANAKKASFLRTAVRQAGVQVTVVTQRIEAMPPIPDGPHDVVSARALAPLHRLIGLAHRFCGPETRLLLLKGQDFVHEVEEASKSWAFDLVSYDSITDSAGKVLVVSRISPEPRKD